MIYAVVMDASTNRAICRIGLVVAVLAGVVGQVRNWAAGYGMWGDELYIVVNVRDHTFGQLTGRLDYGQVAPPGWLGVERLLLLVFGTGERILTLPSLLATLTVLGLGTFVAYRVVGHWAAVLVAALLALAPALNRYAGEVKQYATEAALAMMVITVIGLLRRDLARRAALVAGVVLTLAVAGSYTAVIAVTGAVAGLGVLLIAERRWRSLLRLGLAATPSLVLGAVEIGWRQHVGFGPPDLYAVFATGFPPAHASLWQILAWVPGGWSVFVANPLHWADPAVVALLVVAGLVALVVRDRAAWAAIIAGVLLVSLAAAGVRGYPFGDRVSIYLVAPVIIAVAAAVDGAVRLALMSMNGPRSAGLAAVTSVDSLSVAPQAPTSPATPEPALAADAGAVRLDAGRRVLAAIAAVVAAVALGLSASPAARLADAAANYPVARDDGRAMVQEVAARVQPGDVVLGYHFSSPLLRWYDPMYGLAVAGRLILSRDVDCHPETVPAAVYGAKRIWYLQNMKYSGDPSDYSDRVLAKLTTMGTIVATDHWATANWALIDVSKGPDPHPPHPDFRAEYDCLSVWPVI
jgi:hypothetical protein